MNGWREKDEERGGIDRMRKRVGEKRMEGKRERKGWKESLDID